MVGICAHSVTHFFVVSEQIRKTLSENVSQNLTFYTFVSSLITMKFKIKIQNDPDAEFLYREDQTEEKLTELILMLIQMLKIRGM